MYSRNFLLECTNSGMWAVMYLYLRGIDFASSYDFYFWFWNCSDDVIFVIFHFISTGITKPVLFVGPCLGVNEICRISWFNWFEPYKHSHSLSHYPTLTVYCTYVVKYFIHVLNWLIDCLLACLLACLLDWLILIQIIFDHL